MSAPAATAARGLDAFLRVSRRAYPAVLVPDAAFAKAEAAAEGLPPAYGFILECWLKGAEADVDFQCFFRQGEGARLAESVPGDSPTWRAAQAIFAAREKNPDLLRGLWLEYDLGDGDGGRPAPRVGFSHDAMLGGLDAAAREKALASYHRALEFCRGALAPGIPEDPLLRRTIARALAAVPEGGYVYGTGFAPPPAVSPLRWCVSVKTMDECVDFLRAMDWPETEALAASLPRPDGLRHPVVNCDLSDGLGPKIGIEYYLNADAWAPFFADLARRGLCHERWLPHLPFPDAYCGRAEAGEGWPEEIAQVEDLTGRAMSIASRLAHAKIVWKDGQWRDAKAYLYGTYG